MLLFGETTLLPEGLRRGPGTGKADVQLLVEVDNSIVGGADKFRPQEVPRHNQLACSL